MYDENNNLGNTPEVVQDNIPMENSQTENIQIEKIQTENIPFDSTQPIASANSGQPENFQRQPQIESNGAVPNYNLYQWQPIQQNTAYPMKKKGSAKKVLQTIAIVAVVVICVAATFFGGTLIGKKLSGRSNKTYPTVSTVDPVNNANKQESQSKAQTSLTEATNTTSVNNGGTVVTDVSSVVEAVMPSIVSITNTQYIKSGYGYGYGSIEDFFGYGNGGYETSGAGSGIIIGQNDSELLLVTNEHVVADADELSVQFIDDTTVPALVKGTDADADLAVVAIKLSDISNDTMEKIKVATIGDSDAIEVGEGVIAIGNALGYGQSVTTGVVSAKDREVQMDSYSRKLLQTDAAINPGNSGGALLNVKGEVVGINAAKYSSDTIEGMGFAIPISQAKDIINALMNKETKVKVDENEKGYLGIYGADISESISEMYDIPVGIRIRRVIEGGAAQKAGLEKGQVIVKINGETVTGMAQLQSQLEYYKIGDTVTITVKYPDGSEYAEKDVSVVLGRQIEESSDNNTNGNSNQNPGIGGGSFGYGW